MSSPITRRQLVRLLNWAWDQYDWLGDAQRIGLGMALVLLLAASSMYCFGAASLVVLSRQLATVRAESDVTAPPPLVLQRVAPEQESGFPPAADRPRAALEGALDAGLVQPPHQVQLQEIALLAEEVGQDPGPPAAEISGERMDRTARRPGGLFAARATAGREAVRGGVAPARPQVRRRIGVPPAAPVYAAGARSRGWAQTPSEPLRAASRAAAARNGSASPRPHR